MDSDLQKLSLLPKRWDNKNFPDKEAMWSKYSLVDLGAIQYFRGTLSKSMQPSYQLLIYLMHLAYAASLSQHVRHAKLICGVHILWEGECFICRLQKIPSRRQHSTSTCLISTPHSQTLLTMHKEFQMQFDFRHEYIWHIECLVF